MQKLTDAKANTKLKNLFEFLLEKIPIKPPIVVPIVPKNKPNNATVEIPIKNFLSFLMYCFYYIYMYKILLYSNKFYKKNKHIKVFIFYNLLFFISF